MFGSVLIEDQEAIQQLKNVDKKGQESESKLQKMAETGAKIGGVIAAGAGIAGVALGGLLAKTVETTSNINKFSQVAGMSTDGFQQWDHVMKTFGYSVEDASGDMAALAERAMDAASGAGENAEMFKELGVSVMDSSGQLKTQEQLFNETIAGLQGMEDITRRNAIATAMLSTTGEELAPVLNMTAGELQNMKNNANVISPEQLQKAEDFRLKWESAKNTFSNVSTEIGLKLMPTFEKVLDWVTTNMPMIQSNTETVFNKIGDAIKWVKENSDILLPVLGGLLGAFVALKVISIITAGLNLLRNATLLQTFATKGLNAAMRANPMGIVITIIGLLVAAGIALYQNWDTVKAKAGQLWSGIKTAFDNVKNKISSVMESAKTIVGNAIDKIKGFFNFKVSFPKIKLPHFSISGSANPLKWLDEGVPKLSVKWYAKGGIFDKPTLFNTANGLKGVGEKGPEAVLPLNDSTLGGIGKGIVEALGGFKQSSNDNKPNRPIILQIDGKTFAQIIGDYTDTVDGTRIRNIARGLA